MNRILRVHGYNTENGKATKVTLRFNEDKKLLNPRALAASSMVGWGRWQQSKKIETKWGPAWYVGTAGHGGYLLVTQKPPADLPFGHEGLGGEPAFFVEEDAGVAYVWEFEEDCNWAILEYFDETARETTRAEINRYRVARGEEAFTSEQFLNERVIPTIKQWHQEYLAKTTFGPLNPFECWMVQSNVNTIQAGEMTLETVLATLRHNGYPQIAAAVEQHMEATSEQVST
jgi:hypothetical protein